MLSDHRGMGAFQPELSATVELQRARALLERAAAEVDRVIERVRARRFRAR